MIFFRTNVATARKFTEAQMEMLQNAKANHETLEAETISMTEELKNKVAMQKRVLEILEKRRLKIGNRGSSLAVTVRLAILFLLVKDTSLRFVLGITNNNTM